VGQSRLGRTDWLWLEVEAFQVVPADQFVPPAIAKSLAGARTWAFSAVVGSRLVQAMCVVPLLTDESPADHEASLATMRAECSGMLSRITLTER
jgi:hypothetical protein